MKRKWIVKGIVFSGFTLVLTSCMGSRSGQSEAQIVHMQLIDRNGFTETISNKERIKELSQVNYLASQPYRKVMRVYDKGNDGQSSAIISTYHSNGEVWQYLEMKGGRANGLFKEWYPSGQLRFLAKVIEGVGDLTEEAQRTWVFDGLTNVYNEDGNSIAEIIYHKGKLHDVATYYHENGSIAKTIPYQYGKIEGEVKFYSLEGELIGLTEYKGGVKHGSSYLLGDQAVPRREEMYKEGLLIDGKYWDIAGELYSEVEGGYGIKPVFSKGKMIKEYEYQKGLPEGAVKLYNKEGGLASYYHILDTKKTGEEWVYYESKPDEELKPKLFITWLEDEINGKVRTWYPNGVMESEKEMANNKKHGLQLAWYDDNTLMMVEEYDMDTLVNGKYMKKGEERPCSRVREGKGEAMIYNGEGKFIRKVLYEKGVPSEG